MSKRQPRDGVSCADVPEMFLEFVYLIVEGCGVICVWPVG